MTARPSPVREALAGVRPERLVWGLGGLALCYVVFRAFTLSMTCDEAWSAQGFPQASLFTFVTPAFIAASNNHFLNSWLMNLSLTVFGKSDWAARLPALCGGVVYIVVACRLALTHASSWRAPALAALLLGNPYLLDFLSLARGYSLGLGFMLLGLQGLLSGQERGRAWCLPWFALAVLSHLGFVYTYLTALALVWGEAALGRDRASRWRWPLVPTALTLALLAAVYVRALALAVANNEYYWGSQLGFVDGTLASLLATALYEPPLAPGVFTAMAQAAAGLMAVAAASGCLLAARGAGSARAARPFFTAVLFLGVCCAGIVTEHTLFGTPYLKERGALFLYPQLCLVAALWAEYARRSTLASWLSGGTLAALVVLSALNLARSANLSHVSTWRHDACAKAFMARIHEENFQRNFTREPVRLTTAVVHGHTLNYYIDRLGMGYVVAVLPEARALEADYLIVPTDQAALLAARGDMQEVLRCPVSGGVLLRKVKAVQSGSGGP